MQRKGDKERGDIGRGKFDIKMVSLQIFAPLHLRVKKALFTAMYEVLQ